MKAKFPQEYISTINRLLVQDSDAFWEEVTRCPPRRGIRFNTLKVTPQEGRSLVPFQLQELPWTNVGYLLGDDAQAGKHPLHAAGIYYLQEPSAMAAVEILDPQPGELILDIAAAPGGKTTQIASAMKQQGIILANDPHQGRIQALIRNLDRWGAKNVTVTSEQPVRLADHLGPIFDRVLVDAPCSGEGMFRAHPGEINNWSERLITRSADLQNEILWHSSRLVKPGGVLVYSTCTFNHSENEDILERFLVAKPEFTIEEIPPRPGFSPGIGPGEQFLEKCIRIWPHRGPGEGHFIAKLRHSDNRNPSSENQIRMQQTNLSLASRKIYQGFYKQVLGKVEPEVEFHPENDRLAQIGSRLYYLPANLPDLVGLRIIRWGWLLGDFQKDRFQPAHSLALGLQKKQVQKVLELPLNEPNLTRFLKGLVLKSEGEKGWLLVTTHGFPLGWAKRVHNRLKSSLPSWMM